MSGKQARESRLHQLVNMALGEAYRKDRLIMFVVLDFLPWLFNKCDEYTLLFRASGNVGAIAELERNDDRYRRYVPACTNFRF